MHGQNHIKFVGKICLDLCCNETQPFPFGVEETRARGNGSQEVIWRVATVAASSFSTYTVRSERKLPKYAKRCTPFPPKAFLAVS